LWRIHQRGDIFHCHLEHCTRLWRAGAGIIGQHDKARDRMNAKELPTGQAYQWSITYDPHANGGRGRVTATLNVDTASDELSADHKADGAEFNRFGLLNVTKQWDSAGKLWLDDVTINGEREDFSRDPAWDSSGNRRIYETLNVRPRLISASVLRNMPAAKGPANWVVCSSAAIAATRIAWRRTAIGLNR
jgi:hypothetical protein